MKRTFLKWFFILLIINLTKSEFVIDTLNRACEVINLDIIAEKYKLLFEDILHESESRLLNESDSMALYTTKIRKSLVSEFPKKDIEYPVDIFDITFYFKSEYLDSKGNVMNKAMIEKDIGPSVKKYLKYGIKEKDFKKYFINPLYCFRVPSVIAENKRGVKDVDKIRENRYFFVNERFNTTLLVMLKQSYVRPQRKMIINIVNRLKIVQHFIKITVYLKTVGLKLCRFRLSNFLIIETKVPSTFVALKSADQTYHHFKLNHMNTNDLVPIDQECVESTLNVKYSPEAINPSNINSELFKEGKIVDEFIMEFSLAFMVLGFEYMYKICLLYTSPSPRDGLLSRMPSSA